MKIFSQQLELFEESIAWDVDRFFLYPREELTLIIEEVETAIEKHHAALNEIRENPEISRNPITLFELKLRQYELMNVEFVERNDPD